MNALRGVGLTLAVATAVILGCALITLIGKWFR